MLTRQERRTQKKVLAQREEARQKADTLSSEVTRLQSDVNLAAAEVINAVRREAAAQIAEAKNAEKAAVAERDRLRADMHAAAAAEFDALNKTIIDRNGQIAELAVKLGNLMSDHKRLGRERDDWEDNNSKNAQRANDAEAEMAKLKLEDVKMLRKRLQKKTEQIADLEKELIRAKSKAATIVQPSMHLIENLAQQLRLRHIPKDLPMPALLVSEPPAPPPIEPPSMIIGDLVQAGK